MDARSEGKENRGKPFWWEKLDSDSGQFAGSSTLGSSGKITFEKFKQTEIKNMNKETQTVSNDVGQLAEDARALMAATADVAGEKVGDARKRLAAALERAKEIGGCVRDKAVAGAKAADVAMRENPYQAIAIGVGVGALIGYLVARRCACNRN